MKDWLCHHECHQFIFCSFNQFIPSAILINTFYSMYYSWSLTVLLLTMLDSALCWGVQTSRFWVLSESSYPYVTFFSATYSLPQTGNWVCGQTETPVKDSCLDWLKSGSLWADLQQRDWNGLAQVWLSWVGPKRGQLESDGCTLTTCPCQRPVQSPWEWISCSVSMATASPLAQSHRGERT